MEFLRGNYRPEALGWFCEATLGFEQFGAKVSLANALRWQVLTYAAMDYGDMVVYMAERYAEILPEGHTPDPRVAELATIAKDTPGELEKTAGRFIENQ